MFKVLIDRVWVGSSVFVECWRGSRSPQRRLLYDVCCHPAQGHTDLLPDKILCVLLWHLVFLFPPDGPDTPEIFPPHKYFEEGRSMWLSCQAVSHPKAHYSWNVNGEPWNSRQELSIHQVSISNNGLYTCLVNNTATGRNNSKVKEVIIVGEWLLVTSGPISEGGVWFSVKSREDGSP